MIRPAVHDDLPEIADLGARFFHEAGWSGVASWDTPSILATLASMLDADEAVVLVVEVASRIVGMAGAMAFPHYFNANETAAEELFLWVEPEHRSGFGAQMLVAMEVWAKAQGALSFGMSSIELLRPEATARLYARRGYRATQRTFIKRL